MYILICGQCASLTPTNAQISAGTLKGRVGTIPDSFLLITNAPTLGRLLVTRMLSKQRGELKIGMNWSCRSSVARVRAISMEFDGSEAMRGAMAYLVTLPNQTLPMTLIG